MSQKPIHSILVRPLLTERTTQLQAQNQYVFSAHPTATKGDIKAAVESLFKVNVRKVHTMLVHGKFRRSNRGASLRPDWKKAIVTVKEGQTIDLTPKPAA